MNPLHPLLALLGEGFALFLSGVLSLAILAMAADDLSDRARRLAATVAIAMKRADVTQDYVHHVTGIPASKLSEQLSGRLPLTALPRILGSEVIASETDFEIEFLALRAQELGCALVPKDLGAIVARLDLVLPDRKVMLKASIAVDAKKESA